MGHQRRYNNTELILTCPDARSSSANRYLYIGLFICVVLNKCTLLTSVILSKLLTGSQSQQMSVGEYWPLSLYWIGFEARPFAPPPGLRGTCLSEMRFSVLFDTDLSRQFALSHIQTHARSFSFSLPLFFFALSFLLQFKRTFYI